ncbi:MAG: SpoIID/LytB domain-containing protein [Thermoleophilia bacterium]|nr:SpoIID/LytB domain-containing protein [Thermoleophilia bacterium]
MMNDRVVSRRGHAFRVSHRSPETANRRRLSLPWVVGLSVLALAALVMGTWAFAPTARAASSFTFAGQGNGHGVGLSQWGAWQAAREGNTYKQILAFYYPNTTLQQVTDAYKDPADQVLKVRISSKPWTSNTTSYSQVDMKPTVSAATLNGEAVPVGALVRVERSGGQVKVTVDGVSQGVFNYVDLKPGSGGASEGRINIQLTTSGGSAIDYREYWGILRVQPGDAAGELWVYNFVDLEKYVRSIAEVEYDWATTGGAYSAYEAVKAQAVAARTYAVAKDGNTLADNWADQCYRGYSFEAKYPGIAKAATDTAGEILTYGGTAITAFFSGHSGGYTTASAWTGKNALPYIVAQPDPWSLRAPPDDPGWTWSYTIAADKLSGKVNGVLKDASGKTVSVGEISEVAIVARETVDAASRAKTLRLTGSKGTADVSVSSFRSLLGTSNILTTLILTVNGDVGVGNLTTNADTGSPGGTVNTEFGDSDTGTPGSPDGGLLMPGEFYDVGLEHPYHDEISRVITAELMSGYEDGLFKPEGAVSRAQFAKIAVCLYNITHPVAPILVPNVTTKPFDDVPISSKTTGDASDWIAAAKGAGLVSGVTSTTFFPYTEIQRDQMATMMCRALSWDDEAAALSAGAPGFSDVPRVSPHWAPAAYLLSKMVLLGYGESDQGSGTVLGADEAIKRMHVAVILCRVLDLE